MALWRRWVATHLMGEGAVVAPAPASVPVPAPEVPVAESAARGDAQLRRANPVTEPAARPLDVEPSPVRRGAAVPESTRPSERRSEVRARFDALTDRLRRLEDAIDVMGRRLSHRSRRERSTDRRTGELALNIAESVEAQTGTLDRLSSALERIERRLERIERAASTNREEGERRESRAPKARHSEPPRSVHPPRLDDTGDFSTFRDHAEDDEASISGSSIRGSIGDMSLSTVLAMLEIERRSGRLKVQADDGALVAFELEGGSVVGSRASENDVDPVESLREVLTWRNGRFWFRQNPAESQISPPRSVNSLLLEATRQIDEAIRVG